MSAAADLAAMLREAEARGAARERAQIVEYLRTSCAYLPANQTVFFGRMRRPVFFPGEHGTFARLIEAAEHHRPLPQCGENNCIPCSVRRANGCVDAADPQPSVSWKLTRR